MVKGQKSDAIQAVLAHERRVLFFGFNTPRGGIEGKLNHYTVPRARLCLPPCVTLCNSRSAHTPFVSQPLPSHPAATVSYAAVLFCCLPHLPLLLACPNQNSEVAGRHPIGLGTEHTLSPLVRVLVSFEHEANLFYTRHQNPYMVVTWGDLVGD